MKPHFLTYLFFMLSLLLNFSAHAQTAENVVLRHYDESIFLISNYSGTDATSKEWRSVQQLLDLDVDGFRFSLEWEKQQNKLMLRKADGSSTPFLEELILLKEHLNNKPDKLLTLFLDFNVNMNELRKIFEESGIKPYIYFHEEETGWPSLKQMVETGKRLVIFGMQEHRNSPDWLHYIWDHAVEPYYSIIDAPQFIGEFLKGDPKNKLLIYNDFNAPIKQNQGIESFFSFSKNPILIEHIKSVWFKTGKTPNFIMLDTYQSWVLNILYTLRDLKTISGTVTFNAQILDFVNWEGTNSFTSGRFSFPLGPGETITLTPQSPGYRFKPESVTIVEPNQNKSQNFIATPIEITENLEAYYDFDDGARDKGINGFNGKEVGMQYISDPDRGVVAKFNGNNYIQLPKAEDLKIRDHDFTVSAWVKIDQYIKDKIDYCVIGSTSSSYQQGIHLNIRNQKPYFGFWGNDLEGKKLIEEKTWHHFVWRYNKLTGEQAMFVNGKLDSRSVGHPTYKGRDNIFIGLAFKKSTSMVGYIDNVSIWSRMLSEEEIWNLSRDVIDLVPSKNIFVKHPILSRSTLILLLLALSYLLYKKSRKHFHSNKNIISPEKLIQLDTDKENDYPSNNFIQLFGDFKAVDKDGNDITNQFTPKLKQLFLLILIYSQQNKKGITTRELSEILWPELSYQNAKNSRGVTIRKLRIILNSFDEIQIIFNVDCWTIQFSKGVYCDYVEGLKLLKENKEKTPDYYLNFYKIIRSGEIFKGESHDWLDDHKGFVANNIIDLLMKFMNKLIMERDHELILKLADRMLIADPVNDQAISYKIKALIHQNNINTARFTYDKFANLYEELYNEKLALTFEDLAKT